MSKSINYQKTPMRFPSTPTNLRKKVSEHKEKTQTVVPSQQPTDSSAISVPLTPRKSPKPGSDMDIMVRDLERTGAISKQPEPESPRPKPREGSEMSEMLANIDAANTNFHHAEVKVGANGTLALLENPAPKTVAGEAEEKTLSTADRADSAVSGGGVAIEGVEQVGNNASDIAEVLSDAVEQGSQVASQSVKSLGSTAMDFALKGASVASGALVVPLVWLGAKKLKEGVKEGDLDKKLEGGNTLAIAARSGATAATLASGASQTLSTLGQVASVAAPVLGVGTAAVDGILGIREIKKGKKTDGLLRIGFALSVGAAAVGAGPVATIATAGFLAARVTRKIHEVRQNRKKQIRS
jgi:hypothetical protein